MSELRDKATNKTMTIKITRYDIEHARFCVLLETLYRYCYQCVTFEDGYFNIGGVLYQPCDNGINIMRNFSNKKDIKYPVYVTMKVV